jgi:hypothetical protein
MKKNISLFTILLLSIMISSVSCKKEDFTYPEGKVGVSKITYYIDIAPKGDQLIIINQGTTYTDQGALSVAGGKDAPYTSSGTVNTATPGIYIINYSATNEDGFSSSAYRTVVVMDPAAGVKDLSGSYARSTNGVVSVWTKTAPGVYSVRNPGGAPGATFAVTVVNYSGNIVAIPQQESSVGTFGSANGVYNPAGPSYSWNIVNGGYGTQSRTFNKQ